MFWLYVHRQKIFSNGNKLIHVLALHFQPTHMTPFVELATVIGKVFAKSLTHVHGEGEGEGEGEGNGDGFDLEQILSSRPW